MFALRNCRWAFVSERGLEPWMTGVDNPLKGVTDGESGGEYFVLDGGEHLNPINVLCKILVLVGKTVVVDGAGRDCDLADFQCRSDLAKGGSGLEQEARPETVGDKRN